MDAWNNNRPICIGCYKGSTKENYCMGIMKFQGSFKLPEVNIAFVREDAARIYKRWGGGMVDKGVREVIKKVE